MFPGQENGSNWKILSMNQTLKKCFIWSLISKVWGQTSFFQNMLIDELNYKTELSSKNSLIQGESVPSFSYGEPLKQNHYLWELFPSCLGEPINLIKNTEVSFPVVSDAHSCQAFKWVFSFFHEILSHINSFLTDYIAV